MVEDKEKDEGTEMPRQQFYIRWWGKDSLLRQNLSWDLNEVREQARFLREKGPDRANSKCKGLKVKDWNNINLFNLNIFTPKTPLHILRILLDVSFVTYCHFFYIVCLFFPVFKFGALSIDFQCKRWRLTSLETYTLFPFLLLSFILTTVSDLIRLCFCDCESSVYCWAY